MAVHESVSAEPSQQRIEEMFAESLHASRERRAKAERSRKRNAIIAITIEAVIFAAIVAIILWI